MTPAVTGGAGRLDRAAIQSAMKKRLRMENMKHFSSSNVRSGSSEGGSSTYHKSPNYLTNSQIGGTNSTPAELHTEVIGTTGGHGKKGKKGKKKKDAGGIRGGISGGERIVGSLSYEEEDGNTHLHQDIIPSAQGAASGIVVDANGDEDVSIYGQNAQEATWVECDKCKKVCHCCSFFRRRSICCIFSLPSLYSCYSFPMLSCSV